MPLPHYMLWSQWIPTPSKPSGHHNGLEWKEIRCSAEGTQNMSRLDLKHDECRRVRISQGYKAGELQPHYLIQLKYKKCGHAELHKRAIVRKLDLSCLCFSLNFYFLVFFSQFPFMFPLLTYSQSFFSLSADYPRHSRQRRSKILIQLIQEQSKYHFMT